MTHPLDARVGYNFRDDTLRTAALTHPSTQRNRTGAAAFERLEFLGDRVLSLIIATQSYTDYPDAPEGTLAKILTALVRRESLVHVAEALQLQQFLNVAEGSMGPNVLADAVEALIGAIYLDVGQDLAVVGAVILPIWEDFVQESATQMLQDPKSTLQEYTQRHGLGLPKYKLLAKSGPDHAPTIEIVVLLANGVQAVGRGGSRKVAEQAAAADLLQMLQNEAVK